MVLYYLLKYPYLILLVPPVLLWMFFHLRGERQWRMILRISTCVALAVAGFLLVASIPQMTRLDWCAARLAPAVSWVKGYRLYYPAGEGPMLTRLYGPVASIVYTPAAMAATPTPAILIGVLINLILFFAPALWLIWTVWKKQQQPRLLLLSGIALFTIVVMRNDALSYVARMVSTDAPAIGFAACACAVLVATSSGPAVWSGILCGTFAALSIWSKQTLCPLLAALIIYAFLANGVRWALRFSLAFLGGMLFVSMLIVVCFGWRELYFNMIVLPSGRPWQNWWLGPRRAILRSCWMIWRDARPIDWLLVGAILLHCDLPLKRSGGLRAWAHRNPWLLMLMVAIFTLPLGAYAYAQVGGRSNVGAPTAYFGLLAAVTALSSAWSIGDDSQPLPASSRLARLGMVAALVAITCAYPKYLLEIPSHLAGWLQLRDNNSEIAYRHAKARPERVWFPNQPLATLLAEGRIYHFEDSIYCMQLIGMKMSPQQVNEGIPEHLEQIIFTAKPFQSALAPLLPDFDFDHPRNWPELPDTWFVVTRRGESR